MTSKRTPAELRSQAPVVGGTATADTDEVALDLRVDALEAALAPVTALIDTPATNIAVVTGGASVTEQDDEARAAIDGILELLVDAGLMEAPE